MLTATFSIFSQDIWQRQQTPTNKWLIRCSFTDSLNGWAVGEDGVIIHTVNGGTNWVLQNSPVDFFIYDIYFLNNRLGWGLANDNFANGTAVISTTNGGANWSYYRILDSTSSYFGIHFMDSLTGLVCGYMGKILRTTNGGQNWLQTQVDSSFSAYVPLYRIYQKNNITVASGGAYDIVGAVWLSTNQGINWKSYPVAGEPIFAFEIFSQNKIIAMGGDFEFGAMQTRTFNSGTNWSYDYLNTFGIPRGLSFRTEAEGWSVLSISARFMYTLDSGSTWNTMDVPDTISLYDIKFTDSRNGFAVGTRGGVFKYNSSLIGISGNQNNLPLKASLFQNYPNPFNPSTTIKYKLNRTGIIKIIIYDAAGREVKRIYEGLKPAGEHSIMFDANGLSSGVYLYKLEAGDYSETKKMVIIK
jgi:photosystem II stability/assembly factor-like uncharacterized protein